MSAVESNGWSEWPAPAKLNLFLRIVGRRSDGYHDLQTVFQLLDWGDDVRLRLRTDGRIVRHNVDYSVAPDDDLTVRAAHALQQAAGVSLGADIAVVKRIPLGGGFGGGSSDAATVLVALNTLWRCGLSAEALAVLGLRLGSDVPVFVHGRSAWAEGRGEKLTPLSLPPRWYVVLDSGVRVATAELFQAPDLTRNAAPRTIADFDPGTDRENAFEPVLRRRQPAVDAALDALSRFGHAQLTGTGGGCFAAFANEDDARAACAALSSDWRCYVAQGVNCSPLLDCRKAQENTQYAS